MYELFVDNQRFFRRYFSLHDLAEDKKSALEVYSSRGGRGERGFGYCSLSLFWVLFSLSGEQRVGRWLKSWRKLS